jgi:4-amino-4-deoxy-L-arabinose transferase-like glycosyltransferase
MTLRAAADLLRGSGMRPVSGPASRLVSSLERVVTAAAKHETAVITGILACFLVLWTLYHALSAIAISADYDTSEVSVWAQHFAFGHKHPPLTAWIFGLWFSIFPRSEFAVYLLSGVIVTAALAVAWRIARDHLDISRAMVGLAGLMLVPFYTFRAATLDANTAMMPFWAAAVLFYLRARRGLGGRDAALAGAFAGLTFLGKYWAVWLVAGMAAASVTGAGTKAFWRSSAPWIMATTAALVVAPHLWWYLTANGGDNYAFVTQDVLIAESASEALARSGRYLAGSIAYAAGPLIFLAALLPSRAALADIVRPRDPARQQALVLLAVPLVLPAIANALFPQRLTALWTFPNWPLLAVVLFGSPLITTIDGRAAARSLIVALVTAIGALAWAPVRAWDKLHALSADAENHRAYYAQVAAALRELAQEPAQDSMQAPAVRPPRMAGGEFIVGGSWPIVRGLSFYLPHARILRSCPVDAGLRADIGANGIAIICTDGDAACLASAATFAAARTADITITPTFLGFAAPPARYHITVVPAEKSAGNAARGTE